MIKTNIKLNRWVVFITIMVVSGSCFKDLTVSNIVYQNDFEQPQSNTIGVSGWNSTITSFGPVTDPRISVFNNSKVFGKFNNNIIQVNLKKLPVHHSIRVEMDLYLHNQWNNNLWKMDFDGGTQLLTGFSNNSSIQQSYPNWLGNGTALSPAGAEAQNTQLPGICSSANIVGGTSMYHIITTNVHSADTFSLTCSDAGPSPNDTCLRSWSIDNLKITVFNH